MAIANITNNILTDSGVATSALQLALNGTGFVKIVGTTISYDNSTYLTTSAAASTYQTILTNPVTGTGTTNYLPKFTGASTIGNSIIQDSGSAITITGSNYLFNLSGGGTSRIAASINNTSGNLEWGLEGSAGNQLFTGMAAYQAGIGTSNNTSLNFATNTVVRMQLNTSGNLGLGVTPSAWFSGTKALQINGGSIYAANTYTFIGSNTVYTSAGDQYINTGFATVYGQLSGEHRWYNAPSGTAGAAISFTQAMTLTASGRLLLGTTSEATYLLDVNGTGRFSGNVNINKTGSSSILFLSNGDITTINGTYAAFFEPQNGGKTSYFGRENAAGDWVFSSPVTPYSTVIAAYNSTAPIILGHNNPELTIANGGAATFSSSVTSAGALFTSPVSINGSSIPSDRWFEVTGTTSGKVFGAVFNPTFTYTGANIYGIYVGNNFGTGTITNSYNLYVEGTSAGSATITNKYGIYQAGGSDKNYFAGNVLIGTTTDSGYKLDVNGTGRFTRMIVGGTATSRILQVNTSGNDGIRILTSGDNPTLDLMQTAAANAGARNWRIVTNWEGWGTMDFQSGTNNTNDPSTTRLSISGTTGAATFSSSVNVNGLATSANYKLGVTGAAFISGTNNKGVFITDAASYASIVGLNSAIAAYNGLEIRASGTDYQLYLSTNGNVGIGTSSPSGLARALVVTNTSDYAEIIVERLSSGAGKFGMLIGNSGDLLIRNYTAGTNPLIIAPSGGAATFSSSVTATGFFESSDSRLKTLIQDNYQTKGIASITPKLYTKNGKVELGYYAQDFVGILDSAISKGSDDMLSLSYREVLVAKVYALEQRIKELETKMN